MSDYTGSVHGKDLRALIGIVGLDAAIARGSSRLMRERAAMRHKGS
jgi:hypothetical protein